MNKLAQNGVVLTFGAADRITIERQTAHQTIEDFLILVGECIAGHSDLSFPEVRLTHRYRTDDEAYVPLPVISNASDNYENAARATLIASVSAILAAAGREVADLAVLTKDGELEFTAEACPEPTSPEQLCDQADGETCEPPGEERLREDF